MTDSTLASSRNRGIRRLLERALQEAALDEGAATRVQTRGGELVEGVVRLMRELAVDRGETSSQRLARRVLGERFLGIPEVAQNFGDPSDADVLALQDVPFTEEVLCSVAKTHALVADIGLPLCDMHRDRFVWKHWYDEGDVLERSSDPCWRLIRVTPVEGSFRKTWSEQQGLIDGCTDRVPSARELIYLMILYKLTTGKRLFPEVLVRTSSLDSAGDHLLVGEFKGDEIMFLDWLDAARADDDGPCGRIGIASARRI